MDFNNLPLILLTGVILVLILVWYLDHRTTEQTIEKERERMARERKDLYDRFMSRDFEQYKDNVQPEENNLDEEEDAEEVDLEDAKEEIATEPVHE